MCSVSVVASVCGFGCEFEAQIPIVVVEYFGCVLGGAVFVVDGVFGVDGVAGVDLNADLFAGGECHGDVVWLAEWVVHAFDPLPFRIWVDAICLMCWGVTGIND